VQAGTHEEVRASQVSVMNALNAIMKEVSPDQLAAVADVMRTLSEHK